MSLDRFDDMLSAIRAEDGDDAALAAATQLRVRRSLETRARGRHQLVGLLTAVGILLGGTVSWALATGHLTALWTPVRPPVDEPAPAPRPVAPRRHALVTVPTPAPPPETVAPTPPAPPPEVVSPARPIARPARPPVEALYRRAHELHFHGGAPAQTLAAWDAYLAAEPAGRFSVDARYNRALILIRLVRYAEAAAALAPFARGEVEPAGYHQAEAIQLVARLTRANNAVNGTRGSGDDAP